MEPEKELFKEDSSLQRTPFSGSMFVWQGVNVWFHVCLEGCKCVQKSTVIWHGESPGSFQSET